jgi:hypothetical protein
LLQKLANDRLRGSWRDVQNARGVTSSYFIFEEHLLDEKRGASVQAAFGFLLLAIGWVIEDATCRGSGNGVK